MFDEKTGRKKQMEAHLSSEYNLSDEQARMMVQIGCQDIKKNLDKITEIVGDGEVDKVDLDALKKVAHSLKGVLLNFGMWAEAEIAHELELATKAGLEAGTVKKLLSITKEL